MNAPKNNVNSLTIRIPPNSQNKGIAQKAANVAGKVVSGAANAVGRLGEVALSATQRAAALGQAPAVNCTACANACAVQGGRRKRRTGRAKRRSSRSRRTQRKK
jgi:hypothetical protein